MPKKQANPIDGQVGNRVRLRRMLIGMSQERLGELFLPNDDALEHLLSESRRVWIFGFNDEVEHFLQRHPATPLTLVTNVGQWKLFVSR